MNGDEWDGTDTMYATACVVAGSRRPEIMPLDVAGHQFLIRQTGLLTTCALVKTTSY